MAYHLQKRDEEIVLLVQSGKPAKAVAKEFSLSYWTVCKILKRKSVQFCPKVSNSVQFCPNSPDDNKDGKH